MEANEQEIQDALDVDALINPGGLDLSHLSPFVIELEVQLDDGRYLVPVEVVFSKHCYTREFKEGDLEEDVHYFETRRDGVRIARVVCPQRLDFSKQLPQILKGISQKLCLRGARHHLVLRQEKSAKTAGNSNAGWYLCMEVEFFPAFKKVRLYVASAHHRDNAPQGVRGHAKRFWALFQDAYLAARTTREWLSEIEKKKAPL